MSDDADHGMRQRSRRAPVISLQKALDRAAEFKKEHGTHAVRPASAFKAWGYAEKSSGARQTLATLILYGVLSDSGLGDERRVKLTETALRYLVDERPEARAKLAQKMALAPDIMLLLWQIWGSKPPGDSECRSQLIFEHGFTEGSADEMLAIYKDNIAFANPNGSLIVSVVPEPKGGTPRPQATTMNTPRPGDTIVTAIGMSTEAVLQGLFTQAPTGADPNQLRIRVDGDKLQIAGLNVDLEGIDRLKKMLEKYEEIIRLQRQGGGDMAGLVSERELIIPALRAAAARPVGYISTGDLIQELEDQFQPEGKDAEILAGRKDSHFSQKVRNLISHKDSGTSMFKKGYAEYTGDGIRITDAGRAFLDQVPEFE